MNADDWLAYLTTLADSRFSALYAKGALGQEEVDGRPFGQFFFLCRATARTPVRERDSMRKRWTDLLRADERTTKA